MTHKKSHFSRTKVTFIYKWRKKCSFYQDRLGTNIGNTSFFAGTPLGNCSESKTQAGVYERKFSSGKTVSLDCGTWKATFG